MPTWVSLVDVIDKDYQNMQELASSWGEIYRETETSPIEIETTLALLGDYDFLCIYEAPDRASAFDLAMIARRHGLSLQTMEGVPIDEFGPLVNDGPSFG
ncbi:GYD domain-containing protein [Haladaptatus sp. DYSN1]|uniref:GYD domain-containing protein n=1 Tax=unclassified Haladaptatus TaxID=2622732 RepID=UPI0024068F0B|nr:GYD domain-containing protein [Haladaptatus sp. DYSN1]